MRLTRPGSAPWLLAHELRMLWRSFGIRSRVFAGLGVLFLLLAHLGGYFMVKAHVLRILIERSPGSAIMITVFVMLLVLSSAFGIAVRVLVERGDLELLMTTPVPMTTIYGVRALTVAAACVGSMAFFLLPFANMGPFAGDWRTLAAWPMLASLGLASAALALAATLLLVRWFGVRRARVIAQVVGAVIGIGFVIAMQLQGALPREHQRTLHRWLQAESHEGWFGSDSPLLWPMRAFAGEGLPLLAMVVIGVGLFTWIVHGTQHAFLRAIQDAPQADTPGAGKMSAAIGSREFRSGLVRVVLAKEITLIARDPALLGRALLQVFYLVPIAVMSLQRGRPVSMLAAGLVVLASGLASTLAWITVSGEQAPELLLGAPVDLDRIRWLKVGAALLPVIAIVLPVLAWFAYDSPGTAIVAAVFIVLSLASGGVVQVWSTPLGGSRDFRQRFRQNPFVSIVETLSSLAWAGACWLALSASLWTLAAIAVACLAPVAAWYSGRREG